MDLMMVWILGVEGGENQGWSLAWTTEWHWCHLLRWKRLSGRKARVAVGSAKISGKSLELRKKVWLRHTFGC